MSANLHHTCLVYEKHQGRGRARHDGVDVVLTEPPDIGVAELRTLYFAPDMHIYEVAERCDARRDMTPAEIAAATDLLERVSTAARAALRGEKP